MPVKCQGIKSHSSFFELIIMMLLSEDVELQGLQVSVLHWLIFQLRVIAADSGNPPLSASATLSINVRRNQFKPEFLNFTYETQVLETQDLAVPFLRLFARDQDTVVRQILFHMLHHSYNYSYIIQATFVKGSGV